MMTIMTTPLLLTLLLSSRYDDGIGEDDGYNKELKWRQQQEHQHDDASSFSCAGVLGVAVTAAHALAI